MTCKECNSRNPIGNKFCRECGAKIVIPEGSLAAEEAARAVAERKAERAAVLLSDAHLLAEQGKYIGAIPIVEEAIVTLPFSASAYTLLVTLYEHTEQREKAIQAQKRVIELLPNAAQEAIRLERLERGEITSLPPARALQAGHVPTLRGTGLPTTAPFSLPHWFPMMAGAVGGGFALFLGFLAMTPSRTMPLKHNSVAISPVALSSPATTGLSTNPIAAPPPTYDPSRGSDPFVSLDETRRRLQAQNAGKSVTTAPTLASAAALPLPKPLNGTLGPRSTSPVVVPGAIVKVSKDFGQDSPLPPIEAAPPSADTGDQSGFGNGERVAVTPPGGDVTPSPSPTRPRGYMKIIVSQPATKIPIAAAPPRESAPDLESDPMQKARTLQGLGRYTDAIAAYRDALTAGASSGEAQQGIALCYQRLGDVSNARAAYEQAIAAFREEIKAGRNRGAAQRGLNTCEAALGVLTDG